MSGVQAKQRIPNWLIGLGLIALLAVGAYLIFAGNPFSSRYEIQAVFTSASNVRESSPVRIAGIEVGEVTDVEILTDDDAALAAEAAGEPLAQAAVVTMAIDEQALPLHTDATLKLRPRLFLEGNLFVDLTPGSPNADEIEEGHVFPAAQTSVAVQLDQVLTTLQSDVRANFQILLDEFGAAMIDHGGARGLREFNRTAPGAFRYTSQVNQALLGTEANDLSELIVDLDSTSAALARNGGELQDLIVNLETVTGSFAAEDEALAQAIEELPLVLEAGSPAFTSLNASFPDVRAFAREALPGVRTLPATLDEATPLLGQVRGLVSRDELRGLVADLRPTIPRLARLSRATVPFFDEARSLSSCFNEVIIPWSNETIDDPETPAEGKIFEELGFALTGLNGESRSGDANGQYIRVLAAGGLNTVVIPGLDGAADRVGATALPLLGARPAISSSAKTPFRPEVACDTQEPPDLSSGAAGDPPPTTPAPSPVAPIEPGDELIEGLGGAEEQLTRAQRMLSQGGRADRERGARLGAGALDDASSMIAEAFGLSLLSSTGPAEDQG